VPGVEPVAGLDRQDLRGRILARVDLPHGAVTQQRGHAQVVVAVQRVPCLRDGLHDVAHGVHDFGLGAIHVLETGQRVRRIVFTAEVGAVVTVDLGHRLELRLDGAS
jgi:hypothetical protein